MVKTGNRKTSVRMNLEMSPAVRERLERLSAETEMSLSEVVRRSLAVFDLLHAEKKSGGVILIRTDTGEKEVIII